MLADISAAAVLTGRAPTAVRALVADISCIPQNLARATRHTSMAMTVEGKLGVEPPTPAAATLQKLAPLGVEPELHFGNFGHRWSKSEDLVS